MKINIRSTKRKEIVGDKEDYPRIQTTDLKRYDIFCEMPVRFLFRGTKHKSSLRTRWASVAYLYE